MATEGLPVVCCKQPSMSFALYERGSNLLSAVALNGLDRLRYVNMSASGSNILPLVRLEKPSGSSVITSRQRWTMASDKSEEDGQKPNQRITGLLLMASAGCFLTIGNCLVQYVHKRSDVNVSTFEILLVRSVVQLVFTVGFMVAGRVHPYGKTKNLFALTAMGLTEVGAIVFVYLALERMPVGDATVIQFTAPVFTLAFSFLLLRKGCSLFDTLCGTVSFIGVVIMTKPTALFGASAWHHTHNETISSATTHLLHRSAVHGHAEVSSPGHPRYLAGLGFALLAAIFLSLFFVLNKLAGKKLDVTLTIFYPSILGIVLSPICMAGFHDRFVLSATVHIWAYLIIVGFVSFIGMMLMGEALQLEDAGPAVLIRNLDVVYAFILQYILLKVKPTALTLVGAGIVLLATSLIAIRRSTKFGMKNNLEPSEYKFTKGLDEGEIPLLEGKD